MHNCKLITNLHTKKVLEVAKDFCCCNQTVLLQPDCVLVTRLCSLQPDCVVATRLCSLQPGCVVATRLYSLQCDWCRENFLQKAININGAKGIGRMSPDPFFTGVVWTRDCYLLLCRWEEHKLLVVVCIGV